jgi:ankyrin repeat protein
MAVSAELHEVVDLLVLNDANINARDKRGVTPLLAYARKTVQKIQVEKKKSSSLFDDDDDDDLFGPPTIFNELSPSLKDFYNMMKKRGADFNAQGELVFAFLIHCEDFFEGKSLLHLLASNEKFVDIATALVKEQRVHVNAK